MTLLASRVQTTAPNELTELLCSQLSLLLTQKNYEGVKALLVPAKAVDIAAAIAALPKTMQVIAFRLLSKAEATAVYEYLPLAVQQVFIQEFQDREVIDVVEGMAPDDRAELFDELPSKLVQQLLAQLNPEERDSTALLLGYRPDTAGRIMIPEYMAVGATLTVAQAKAQIRQLAREHEMSYYIYVVDEADQLLGKASLEQLILAEPAQLIRDVMTQDVVFAATNTDQEQVAQLIQRYDLMALPVVDQEQHLLGVVTVDDVIDIIQQETTEDIYTMGAVQHQDESYFDINLLGVARKRVPWLMILLITNAATVFIMSTYEAVLDEVVALAFFTPLLIGTGGNIGAQSSTVIIRGLSTDELRYRQPIWITIRELCSGGILGIMLGTLVMALVLILLGQVNIGLTIAISLVAIATIAATVGSALPLLLHKLGFDPALMAAPFITTVVDILGILIYLNTAKVLLLSV